MLVLFEKDSASMVHSFLQYLSFEKRYSQHTVKNYASDLSQFQAYLFKQFQLNNINQTTPLMVRSWVLSLMDAGMQPKSVNRKLASLRSYFKFSLRRTTITSDPTIKIRSLKVAKDLPSFANETEFTNFLDQIEFAPDFMSQQERVILELLYGTGIRLAELIGLKEKNINFPQQTLKVLGKRNKERIIPMGTSLIEMLKIHIHEKNHAFSQDHNSYLIVNKDGGPSYPMMIYRIVKKYLNQLSSLDKKSPHALRHTFATHLLNKGADLNAVKELLGHSSLASTQVYTHNTLDKLKSVFDQAHPKA